MSNGNREASEDGGTCQHRSLGLCQHLGSSSVTRSGGANLIEKEKVFVGPSHREELHVRLPYGHGKVHRTTT